VHGTRGAISYTKGILAVIAEARSEGQHGIGEGACGLIDDVSIETLYAVPVTLARNLIRFLATDHTGLAANAMTGVDDHPVL
jgi:hypothetical protein